MTLYFIILSFQSLVDASVIKTSIISRNVKVTFVGINSTSLKPYCPKKVKKKVSKVECAKMCVRGSSSCLAIGYTEDSCILWKYVMIEEDSPMTENFYLKDTSNRFDNTTCVEKSAINYIGNCIIIIFCNLLGRLEEKLEKYSK